MTINSWSFLLFFIPFFFLYYSSAVRKTPARQNKCLLIASFLFYAFCEWQMFKLLFVSILIFFILGITIEFELLNKRPKRAALWRNLGVVLGLGILCWFKYVDFFAESFVEVLNALGFRATWTTLHVVLPVGVSFFVFKLISYVIEVFRERIPAERNFVRFGTYVAFFPTILSGPIDRPGTFLPQLNESRRFDSELAIDGFRQVLWGMAKKMIVADGMAQMIDFTWGEGASTLGIILAALVYPLQMYMDFSGYSDMAIGVGKMLGLRVARNFNYPFFSTNVAEYWRRWHMSLTGWLTDYVFMPVSLALRAHPVGGTIVAVMLNMLFVGVWHGANMTYVVFGIWHGLLFIPLILSGAFLKKQKTKFRHTYIPPLSFLMKMLGTYLLVAIGLVIFKAPDVTAAFHQFERMCSWQSGITCYKSPAFYKACAVCAVIMLWEWVAFVGKKKEYAMQSSRLGWRTACLDIAVVTALCLLNSADASRFIYFQF